MTEALRKQVNNQDAKILDLTSQLQDKVLTLHEEITRYDNKLATL
jgi:Na+/phosphate symporter